MEIEIGILTGGLVCMALLVVVQSRNVLRRNQRPPDQALVGMVQDLVNAVLTRSQPQAGIYRLPKAPRPMTDEQRAAALGAHALDDEPEDTTDEAMQVAHMGPPGT